MIDKTTADEWYIKIISEIEKRNMTLDHVLEYITSDLKINIKKIYFLNLFLFQRPCLTRQVLLDLQRRWFPLVQRYLLLYLLLSESYFQAFVQDILCSIYVSVMLCLTVWANPFSDFKIFNFWIFIAAAAANLRTWKELVNFDKLFSIPAAFISQKFNE